MPTRTSGSRGRLYVSATAAGAAVPLPFITEWSIDQSTDTVEVTAMGDTTKTYVQGLPDATGTVNGFYDADGSNPLYAAATAESGSAKRFYLYPIAADSAKYWFGTAIFSASHSGSVSGAVQVSGSWSAATSVSAVGI